MNVEQLIELLEAQPADAVVHFLNIDSGETFEAEGKVGHENTDGTQRAWVNIQLWES